MIYDLFTDGQWFVMWSVAFIVLWIAWEVIFAREFTWDRTGDDPPVILGGFMASMLTCFALAALFGIIHGLTWVWVYG